MKRIFLLSALALTIIMNASAQYGRGNGRGHGHKPTRNTHVNVVITKPAPQVVYTTPAPVPTCAPAPVYVNTLEGYEFNNALSSINAQRFDDGKLCVANQIMAYNYLYSWQVREILFQFSFDSNKVQFAKMAYAKTIDKENFYVVNDAFTFQSSVRELNRCLF